MKGEREKLSSRLGFILLSAACAIGIGNVWRFPYVAGKCGGGWFVVFYLASLLLLGVPVLTAEFACGRAAQRSIAKIHQTLTPEKKWWRLHGLLGNAGLFILMMFYTVVTGWMALYFIKTVRGGFVGLDASAVGEKFSEMLANPLEQSVAAIAVSLSAVAICAIGLRKGLERVNKYLMLSLLALIVVLSVHSLTLSGAAEGVRYYLVPNSERLREVGIMRVAVEAMNQAFFTLSLGIGSMAVFGSYIGRDHSLVKESVNVAALDTFVAICAGLIVIPACFAFGVEPGKGPGLVFVTLPNVFNAMAGGRFWGSVFFLFMSFAAFSTVLAVFEGIIAAIMEYSGWSRVRSSLALGAAISIASLPCVFGFNLWKSFQPLGAGSTVLDLEDFLVSNLLLPIGGIAFTVYVSRRFGWGWDSFVKECNEGRGVNLPRILAPYFRYALPILILALVVLGLYDRFAGGVFQ